MRTPGSLILEDMQALTLGESDEDGAYPELTRQKKYILVVRRVMKSRYGYTLLNPQGGSGGMATFTSVDAAIKSGSRVSQEVIDYVNKHQHGEIPVYFQEWDTGSGEPPLKPLKPIKVGKTESRTESLDVRSVDKILMSLDFEHLVGHAKGSGNKLWIDFNQVPAEKAKKDIEAALGVPVQWMAKRAIFKSKNESRTESFDSFDPATAHKAEALVKKLQQMADAFTKEQTLVVKELTKLGYDKDATDWIYDAWGHIEGTHNSYAKKLIGYIQSQSK